MSTGEERAYDRIAKHKQQWKNTPKKGNPPSRQVRRRNMIIAAKNVRDEARAFLIEQGKNHANLRSWRKFFKWTTPS